MTAARPLPHQVAQVAAAAAGLIALVGVLVWALGAGPPVRRLLGLSFERPARDPQAALEIAVTNMRLLAAALVAAWAVHGRPRLRLPLDLTLAALLALNAVAIGAALGAHGPRLLQALALHGPLELAAFALAGGAYLARRTGQLSAAGLAASAALAAALLATAALAETYIDTGGDP